MDGDFQPEHVLLDADAFFAGAELDGGAHRQAAGRDEHFERDGLFVGPRGGEQLLQLLGRGVAGEQSGDGDGGGESGDRLAIDREGSQGSDFVDARGGAEIFAQANERPVFTGLWGGGERGTERGEDRGERFAFISAGGLRDEALLAANPRTSAVGAREGRDVDVEALADHALGDFPVQRVLADGAVERAGRVVRARRVAERGVGGGDQTVGVVTPGGGFAVEDGVEIAEHGAHGNARGVEVNLGHLLLERLQRWGDDCRRLHRRTFGGKRGGDGAARD